MITSSVFLIKEKVFEIETSTLINQNKKMWNLLLLCQTGGDKPFQWHTILL